jgi:hypothetical protein
LQAEAFFCPVLLQIAARQAAWPTPKQQRLREGPRLELTRNTASPSENNSGRVPPGVFAVRPPAHPEQEFAKILGRKSNLNDVEHALARLYAARGGLAHQPASCIGGFDQELGAAGVPIAVGLHRVEVEPSHGAFLQQQHSVRDTPAGSRVPLGLLLRGVSGGPDDA